MNFFSPVKNVFSGMRNSPVKLPSLSVINGAAPNTDAARLTNTSPDDVI